MSHTASDGNPTGTSGQSPMNSVSMRRCSRSGLGPSDRGRHARLIPMVAVVGSCLALFSPMTLGQDGGPDKDKKQPENVPAQPFNPGTPTPSGPVKPKAPDAKPPVTVPPNPGATPVPAAPRPAAATAQPLPPPDPDPDHFTFNFNAEVTLVTLVNYVQRELQIQIILTDASIADKTVVLTAPIKVRNDQVLPFLARLLESKNYTITRNEFGIYTVVPIVPGTAIPGNINPGEPFSSTQIIDTHGLKPSSLNAYIPALGAGGAQITPLDEFGVIIVTDTPGRTQLIRDFIDQLVKLRDGITIHALDVRFVSAATARERILTLAGESGGTSGSSASFSTGIPPPGGKQVNPTANSGGVLGQSSTSNLGSQISVSPFSNALFFKGREEELPLVENLLELVDVQNAMVALFYDIGHRAAVIISAMGQREGLGEITVQEAGDTTTSTPLGTGRPGSNVNQPQSLQNQNSQAGGVLGAGFVIFPEPGGFMYYGTPEQHARVAVLIEQNKMLSVGERVVFGFYKLKNTKAAEVAEIITSLVNNQAPSGNTGSIVGRNTSGPGGTRTGTGNNRNQRSNVTGLNRPATGLDRTTGTAQTGGVGAIEGDENTFVIADEKNNQIIVKTKTLMQPEFAKLIQKLDARRPQVFIKCQIVAVSGTDAFRLAVETQILAGQFGLNTNYGLGGIATGGNFFDPKSIATALPGVTAAVINSKYVPLIITAIQSDSDSRIVATPQLLLDDNEDGSVSSEQIITSTVVQTQVGANAIQGAGDQVRAGTSLGVTPQISENAVKLTLDINQSSFTGTANASGIPPIAENHLDAVVTVPRDCSIVIGGLVVESKTNTVAKVPLLGDIPILGLLFSDHNKTAQKTTLYVFITPTIMKDPMFFDVRLLTEGPAAESGLTSEFFLPVPKPMGSRIDSLPAATPAGVAPTHDVPAKESGPSMAPVVPAPAVPTNNPPLPEVGVPAPIGADIKKEKKKE